LGLQYFTQPCRPYGSQGSGFYYQAQPVFAGAPVWTNNIEPDYEDYLTYPECRVTVTRTGAYDGRVLVDLLVTNDWYYNYYISYTWADQQKPSSRYLYGHQHGDTNLAGTNIFGATHSRRNLDQRGDLHEHRQYH